MVDYLHKWKK